MSKVIDFKTASQLRDELAAKDLECQALKSQLANVKNVKEMLTLQVLDLKDQVHGHIVQMEYIRNNLESLHRKLTD